LKEGVWEYNALQLYPAVLFATKTDAERLAQCSDNAEPSPTDLALSNTYRGAELNACEPIGEYEYTASPSDEATIETTVRWESANLQNDSARYSWVSFRKGTLLVNPANYWERVDYADCTCHGVGFEIFVQPLTGEVLRYTPGINCVVC